MAKIRVIDIESTGDAPPEHAILEIGYCDIVARSTDLLGNPYDWEVVGGKGYLVNPCRDIPPITSAVHHLVEDDVKDAPTWDAVAPLVFGDKEGVIAFAAHSAKFEQTYLGTDLTGDIPWLCSYKGAIRLWPEAPSHSNSALRYWRKPQGLVREEAMPAHRAYPDAYTTAFLIRDMLEEVSAQDLIKWTTEPSLLPRCKIGKWRGDGTGTPWEEVDDGFLWWLMDKDFDEDVLFTARYHLDKREQEEREAREREDLNCQFRENGMPETEPEGREFAPLESYTEGRLF